MKLLFQIGGMKCTGAIKIWLRNNKDSRKLPKIQVKPAVTVIESVQPKFVSKCEACLMLLVCEHTLTEEISTVFDNIKKIGLFSKKWLLRIIHYICRIMYICCMMYRLWTYGEVCDELDSLNPFFVSFSLLRKTSS